MVQEITRQRDSWLPRDLAALGALFEDDQGVIYRRVIHEARARGLNFALGGGFAVNAYTGLTRNTKDLDLYVVPSDREAMIGVLTEIGLGDYYDQLPYDRGWIYRGYLNGTIVDIIWEMANHIARVDAAWLTRGPEVEVGGEWLRLLPPEELLWTKLYVIQRERCDWPDVLNLIYATGESFDWRHLLRRLGEDAPLLRGALSVFAWMCPGRAQSLPSWLWERLGLPEPPSAATPEVNLGHVTLIDSRPWFSPALTPEPFH